MTDATAKMAALETGEAAETAPETVAAKRTIVLETSESAAKMDCYSKESMALAANLKERCIPMAIEWSLFWLLQVQPPPHLHLQGVPASAPQILYSLRPPRQ